MSKRSRCGAVRICLDLGEPSAEIVRVEALSLWRRANLFWPRRTLCGDCACRSALTVAPCEFVLTSANPMRRSCVSKRSRCGAVRICPDPGEPSAEIVRVEALSLWRHANLSACVSKRSRCGAVRICLDLGEPSAEIVRVEALSLWRRANLFWPRRTLCGDCACRSALTAAPCEFVLTSANPMRRSCVSKRSRCGAVRICPDPGEPSAEIVRVEALSLWRRVNLS